MFEFRSLIGLPTNGSSKESGKIRSASTEKQFIPAVPDDFNWKQSDRLISLYNAQIETVRAMRTNALSLSDAEVLAIVNDEYLPNLIDLARNGVAETANRAEEFNDEEKRELKERRGLRFFGRKSKGLVKLKRVFSQLFKHHFVHLFTIIPTELRFL